MTEILKDARLLANYLELNSVYNFHFPARSAYGHLGALFADIILQAGLNYNSIVKPRVNRILEYYPGAADLSGLRNTLDEVGTSKFLSWNDHVKVSRFICVVEYAERNKLSGTRELEAHLSVPSNKNNFLGLNGIGPKTLDYTLKLLGVDCVAVDRHIIKYVKEAGIDRSYYTEVKQVVEYAADLLNISRWQVDNFIWQQMNRKITCQLDFTL